MAVIDTMRDKGWKGKESRARLLAAATYEFAHQGYYETKVSTIVARAELTQAAFYLYFPSKEAIFEELVADFRTRGTALGLAVRLAPGLNAIDVPHRMQDGIEATFRFLTADVDLARIALFVAPDAGQIKAEMVSLVTENLRAEQQAGYIRPEVAIEIVAECLIGTIERLAARWLFSGEKEPAELAAQTADIVLHGILMEAPSSSSIQSET